MSEMIERVAMALAKMDNFEWDGMKRTTSGAVARDMYRTRARAAIEAMREPTEAMEDEADAPIHDELKKQGQFSIERYGKLAFASSPFSRRVWQTMIDEALK